MKKLLLAAAMLAATGAASAGVATLPAGVAWNVADTATTPNGGNFFTNLAFRQWFEDINGQPVSIFDLVGNGSTQAELTGLGVLELGTTTGKPLPGAYELTFEFGGININPSTGSFDATTSGFLNIYLDRDFSDFNGGFDSLTLVNGDVLNTTVAADATDGQLFLGLEFTGQSYTPQLDPAVGVPGIFPPVNFKPVADSIGTWGNQAYNGLIGGDAQFGFQVSSVNPGLAGNNFDSDWVQYLGGLVDAIGFGLSSKFTVDYTVNGSNEYTGITGINTFSESSTGTVEAFAVSAPSTIGILGLGIIGMGLYARRRKA